MSMTTWDGSSEDAAVWTAYPESVSSAVAYDAPKLGRVRILPVYVFAATSPVDPEVDEVHIQDDGKRGAAWARGEALEFASRDNGTVGRLLRTEKMRWRPWVR
jgi:hypothetical protein